MKPAEISRAAELVRGARNVVALTGAGISTPSGIPDFRSGSGLWRTDNPLEVASLGSFKRDPRRFFRWFSPLLGQLAAALPNPAHLALAHLERLGKLHAVVTQNIDGLHQRAGSRTVYELHGHIRSATCVNCGRQVPADPLLKRIGRGEVPRCSCGGTFKPDVVLFDEDLPRGLYWLALQALDQCDTLIVAGTSLEVAPVCDLPLGPLKRGARMIIVNHGPTHLDERADVVVRDDVAHALPAIVEHI